MNQPLVSVVITTKSEERNIGSCSESVKRQTYPQEKIEIIVVDNNSTDRTKEIAQKYTDKVFNKGPERSAQRNFGMMEKARGKYVMFLDADMILSATVVEKSVIKLENSNLVALYLPEIVMGSSFWSKVRRFERSFYDGTVVDCVRIIRKDKFIQVGGFDLQMTGQEDWDFDKKIRSVGQVATLGSYNFEEVHRKLVAINYQSDNLVTTLSNLVPSPLIYHNEAEFNLLRYLSKKGYYLQTFASYIRKWGKDDPDIMKQVGVRYRLLEVFIEDGRWKRLLSHPFLACGMYFLRFVVAFCFLISKFR